MFVTQIFVYAVVNFASRARKYKMAEQLRKMAVILESVK